MNKKIIGIFVCILFFGTSVIPSISGNILSIDNQKKEIQKEKNKINTQEIYGNIPPVADFAYEQNQENKFEFYFYSEGYSYDPDGEVIYWEWDFGDGSATSYELNPVHTYSKKLKGVTVKVTLRIGDDGDPQKFDNCSREIEMPKNRYIIGKQDILTESWSGFITNLVRYEFISNLMQFLFSVYKR